jgi:hypothetical protein
VLDVLAATGVLVVPGTDTGVELEATAGVLDVLGTGTSVKVEVRVVPPVTEVVVVPAGGVVDPAAGEELETGGVPDGGAT